MDIDLFKTFQQSYPELTSNMKNLEVKTDKEGNKLVRVTTYDGTTYVKSQSVGGITFTSKLEIPYFEGKKERNKFVIELYSLYKYTQDEIAILMGISQSTVSNILIKDKKKKKKKMKLFLVDYY